MRTVKCFLTSSVKEFEASRLELKDYILYLNDLFQKLGITLEWNEPENMSKSFLGQSYRNYYDRYIQECQLFFLIVGGKCGPYTEREFDFAQKQQQTRGAPKIFTWFLVQSGQIPDESVIRFQNRLKTMGYYPEIFEDMNSLKLQLVTAVSQELAAKSSSQGAKLHWVGPGTVEVTGGEDPDPDFVPHMLPLRRRHKSTTYG